MQADANVAALIVSRLPAGRDVVEGDWPYALRFASLSEFCCAPGGAKANAKALGKNASDGDQKWNCAVC